MAILKRFVTLNGIDNSNKTIINVAAPVNDTDVATKLSASNATNLTAGTISPARFPAFEGDAFTTAGTTVITLANSGVGAGTFSKVAVDAKGRVTAGMSLVSTDIIAALSFTPYNASNPNGYTANSTDAQLRDRATHTGTQPAASIVESATQVFVTPADRTAIAHANRAALDSVTGINTGDQTITLTGPITGSGTGSFATTIAANAVSLANMATVASQTFLGRNTAAVGNVEALTPATVKAMLAIGNVDNTTDASKPVSTAQQSALNLKENLSNKATSFGVVNDTLYPTVAAAKAYMDSLVVGLIDDRGGYNASSNTFPTTGGSGVSGAVVKGDLWYVTVAGTLGGTPVAIGDSFRALVDAPAQVAANWGQMESNLGYVPYNASNPNGYTANSTDAQLRDRATHTGTQPAASITGLGTLATQNGTFSGTSSGINTGDETATTIKTALGITTLSGANTGDQTITLSGDAAGTGTGMIAVTLANSGVAGGTYGGSTVVPVFTVDAKGRVTNVVATAIVTSFASLTAKPTTLAGYGITDASSVFANSLPVSQGEITSSVLTTSTVNPAQIIDSFAATAFRSAKFIVQATAGTSYYVTEVMVIHDGTNVYMVEYGSVGSATALFTLDSDILSGNVRLLVTPLNAATTIRAIRTGMKA